MAASVISLPAFWRARGPQEGIPGPWTSQELAELYRISEVLGRAGMPVEMDSGLSDENEPWFVFFSPETGDVIAHFARISGEYVAVSTASGDLLRGTSFRDLVQNIVNDQPLVVPSKPSGNVTRLFMHPTTVLAAFVATALVQARKAIAVTDTEDAGRRPGPSEGTSAPAPGLAPSPAATGFSQTSTAVFASVAALISYVLSTEAEATTSAVDLLHDAPVVDSSDNDDSPSADDSVQTASTHGGEAAAPASGGIHVRASSLQDSSDGTVWLSGTRGEAVSKITVFEPLITTDAPANEVARPHVEGASPTLNMSGLGRVTFIATPAESTEGRLAVTAGASDSEADGKRIILEFSHEHLKVSFLQKELVYLVPDFAAQLMQGANDDEGPDAAQPKEDPTSKDQEALPQAPPAPEALETLIVLDGTETVALGEGRQMLYFSGGTAVVEGFVFGEDILFLSPELVEQPFSAYFLADDLIAVLNFSEGSSITLTGVSFLGAGDVA